LLYREAKVESTREECNDKLNERNKEHSMRIQDLQVKFEQEAEEFSKEKEKELRDSALTLSSMVTDREQLQRVTKALGKTMKEREKHIYELEVEVRDAQHQMKSAQSMQQTAEEKLDAKCVEFLELLDMYEKDKIFWKEDEHMIRLQGEVDRLKAEMTMLEER